MRPLDKMPDWRILYAVCCLIYVSWMVYLSLNNFDMVHGDYSRGETHLQQERIREIARRELVDQCRKELKRTRGIQQAVENASVEAEDACLSWPPAVLAERQQAVEKRLAAQQSSGARKLVVFYLFFGIFVLILPPVILYLLLSLGIWMFKSIKINR